jgi:hypothetical protein
MTMSNTNMHRLRYSLGEYTRAIFRNDFEKGEAQGSLDAIEMLTKAAKACSAFSG